MKPSSRLLSCLRCHTQALVCSDCDRGQVYCSHSCSLAAKGESHRQADKRYQSSFTGKMKHALRQRRYRARLKEKVTDQGSPAVDENALLNHVEHKAIATPLLSEKEIVYCHFCKKQISSWVRWRFLRRVREKITKKWFPFRPP